MRNLNNYLLRLHVWRWGLVLIWLLLRWGLALFYLFYWVVDGILLLPKFGYLSHYGSFVELLVRTEGISSDRIRRAFAPWLKCPLSLLSIFPWLKSVCFCWDRVVILFILILSQCLLDLFKMIIVLIVLLSVALTFSWVRVSILIHDDKTLVISILALIMIRVAWLLVWELKLIIGISICNSHLFHVVNLWNILRNNNVHGGGLEWLNHHIWLPYGGLACSNYWRAQAHNSKRLFHVRWSWRVIIGVKSYTAQRLRNSVLIILQMLFWRNINVSANLNNRHSTSLRPCIMLVKPSAKRVNFLTFSNQLRTIFLDWLVFFNHVKMLFRLT